MPVRVNNGNGEKAAIFAQEHVDTLLVEEFEALFVDMKYDIGATACAFALAHRVLGRTITLPTHGLGAFLIAKRVDSHLVGNHERRVETQTEVAYDIIGVVFVFGKKIFSAREGYLIDVFVDIVGSHAYAVVAHGESSGFFVDCYCDLELAHLALEIAKRCKGAQFLSGIDCIRHQLAEKYLVVAIEKFFDNGKNVLGGYTDCTFLHGYYVFYIFISIYCYNKTDKKCAMPAM